MSDSDLHYTPHAVRQRIDSGVNAMERGAIYTTSGQPLQEFTSDTGPTIPIISSLPVANLPPGAYRLEVSVLRETGNPVVRPADFDIN